jgi:hypothetical protein
MSTSSSTEIDEARAVEGRVQLLEDMEDVRQLKSLYAKQFDEALNSGGSFPPDYLLRHFAEDATWESERFGRYQGRDELREFLVKYRERVSFALDFSVGHLIEIADDRKTARGFWTTWQPMTIDGEAHLLAGRYFDEYARIGEGQWVFTSVRLDVEFLTPYGKGWADERFPENWNWES